jgi:hypothetical protein
MAFSARAFARLDADCSAHLLRFLFTTKAHEGTQCLELILQRKSWSRDTSTCAARSFCNKWVSFVRLGGPSWL